MPPTSLWYLQTNLFVVRSAHGSHNNNNSVYIAFQCDLQNRRRRPDVFRPSWSCRRSPSRPRKSRITPTGRKHAIPARPTRLTNRSIFRHRSVTTVRRKCRDWRPCSITVARPNRRYIQPSSLATTWVHLYIILYYCCYYYNVCAVPSFGWGRRGNSPHFDF